MGSCNMIGLLIKASIFHYPSMIERHQSLEKLLQSNPSFEFEKGQEDKNRAFNSLKPPPQVNTGITFFSKQVWKKVEPQIQFEGVIPSSNKLINMILIYYVNESNQPLTSLKTRCRFQGKKSPNSFHHTSTNKQTLTDVDFQFQSLMVTELE